MRKHKECKKFLPKNAQIEKCFWSMKLVSIYVIKVIFFELQLWHGAYLQLTHSQRKAFN